MLITDKNALQAFTTDKRIWQGIPSIERTGNGRLFATFYSGGIKEELGNYCLLVTSDDDGHTWSEPIAAVDLGAQARCYDPCLWVDPARRLWFIWAVEPEHMVWAALCAQPDAAELSWSTPFPIAGEVMMNRPIITSAGDWLFPISVWDKSIRRICPSSLSDARPLVYKSTDQGKTFTKLGGPVIAKRSFDEHMLLERRDGVLALYSRTTYGIAKSLSYDGGLSWTRGADSGIPGPSSRFHISRLRDGSVLLVNHHQFQGRNNLSAMLSPDDGESWQGFLLLDGRDHVSYPDAVEAPDGSIYIIYDRERGGYQQSMADAQSRAREILMAKVTRQDILAGALVSPGSRLQVPVSKLGAYRGDERNPYAELERYTPEDYITLLLKLPDNAAITQRIFADYGRCCLNITPEQSAELDDTIEKLLAGTWDQDLVQKIYVLRGIVSVLRAANARQDAPCTHHIVERAFHYLNQTLAERTSLDDMAAQLRINKHYLCHLFREHTGTTLVHYKNSRRIHQAKKMLIHTQASLLDIALQVGFDSAAYFSAWFKKLEGVTPGTYRRRSQSADQDDVARGE